MSSDMSKRSSSGVIATPDPGDATVPVRGKDDGGTFGIAATDEMARPGNVGTRDRPPRESAPRSGASGAARDPAQGRLTADQPGRAIPQPRTHPLRRDVLVAEVA